MKWLFSFASFERFHVIQVIEVNISHLLLYVSETSTIALAGIPAGRLWPTHICLFHQHQRSFVHTHSFCFVHHSIFHNLRCSANCLLLPVVKVACLLLIFKLIISLYFLIFLGLLLTNFLSVNLGWDILNY